MATKNYAWYNKILFSTFACRLHINMHNISDELFVCQRFAIIGVAGYIAQRHLMAVKSLGHSVVTAHDIFDSVGIIDNYFPDARFTTDIKTFVDDMQNLKADYLSVCTPNHLHCSHTIMGLEAGADVICEKPLALTVDELNRMDACRRTTGRNVYTILQLRLHPEVIKLKKKIDTGDDDMVYDVDLTYITPRGHWYFSSWKGDKEKSGGLATNIGIHFIDMLIWIFGDASEITVHHSSNDCVAGFLNLRKAKVRFFLSINNEHKPIQTKGMMSPYRRITVNGECIDLSGGFTELHTQSYARITEGQGYSIDETKAAIRTLEIIRNTHPTPNKGERHPLVSNLHR